jgi:hypothetical protein
MRTILKILAGGFGIILGLATIFTFLKTTLPQLFRIRESSYHFSYFIGNLTVTAFFTWATYRLLKFAIKREKQATDSKYLDENL